jgi:hypothetical protein
MATPYIATRVGSKQVVFGPKHKKSEKLLVAIVGGNPITEAIVTRHGPWEDYPAQQPAPANPFNR